MELRTLRYFSGGGAGSATTRSVLIWKKNQVFNTATSLFIQSLQLLRDDAAPPKNCTRAARPPKNENTESEIYKRAGRSLQEKGARPLVLF